MPRNASGVYTLPEPPVVNATIIDPVDENTTRDDVANELTNSLDRNGRGGMLAPFKIFDGTQAAPGLAFTSDTDNGAWRNSADDWSVGAGNTEVLRFTPNTVTLPATATFNVLGTLALAALAVGAISPAQLVANTDNWAPAGLSGAGMIRVSTDASRNLTGLTGGSSGRVILMHNVGAFNLVLKDDVTSAVANRFYLLGDITLEPDAVVYLQYDATTLRWRALPVASLYGQGLMNAATAAAARTLLSTSSIAEIQAGSLNWIAAGGAADVITATYSPVPSGPADGQLYCFRALAANATTTPTFAPNGATARTIVKQGGTALAVGDIPAANAEVILRYNLANTRYELLNPKSLSSVAAANLADSALGGYIGMINGTIVTSRAASAETIAIKTKAGADPSATDPVIFVFRNATLATGDYTVLSAVGPLSVVIPSTATLGASNATAFNVWLTIFNDAGTLRLGVTNPTVRTAGATTFLQLQDNSISSSTLTPASTAGVLYTTGGAVASKAMRVIGFMEYTLAAVGTWNTAPTKTQIWAPGMPLPGQSTGNVVDSYSASGSVNNTTGMVDVTNGSAAITLSSAANGVEVEFAWLGSNPGVAAANTNYYAQILRGATNLSGVDAYQVNNNTGGGNSSIRAGLTFNYHDFPNSTAAQTYKVQHRCDNTGGAGAISANMCRKLTEIQA